MSKLFTEFVRPFPNSEGDWKLESTGETARAVEMRDIYDEPLFAVFIGNGGPFFSIDLENEIFEKIQ
jgi:hypothetical protein